MCAFKVSAIIASTEPPPHNAPLTNFLLPREGSSHTTDCCAHHEHHASVLWR
jgi:hypothetical protein